MTEPEWYRANRASWDERVGVHIGSGGYDLSDLRAGRGKLNAIEEAELPPVEGKRLARWPGRPWLPLAFSLSAIRG